MSVSRSSNDDLNDSVRSESIGSYSKLKLDTEPRSVIFCTAPSGTMRHILLLGSTMKCNIWTVVGTVAEAMSSKKRQKTK